MSTYKKYQAILVCSLLILSGCKEILYSELTEVEANQMVAVLAISGIDADRDRTKDGLFSLLVDKVDIATATVHLSKAGLPNQSFQTLGEVFSAGGIIGTPFEQHARYIHAMNQELAGTLSSIDGIASARVIVNAPLKNRYQREDTVATASVTLHHEAGFDVSSQVAKMKQIVSHSIPELSYENVSLAFFQTPEISILEEKATTVDEVNMAAVLPAERSTWERVIAAPVMFALAGLLLIFCVISLLARFNRPSVDANQRRGSALVDKTSR